MIRTIRYLLLMAALLLLGLQGLNLYHYQQQRSLNRQLAHPENMGADANPADAPELLFARAHYLMQQQQADAALALYAQVAGQPGADAALQEASRYNSGLIYLRQALEAQHADQASEHSRFLPLLELAAHELHAVVSSNPAHYDARLSLEQTLRLLPRESRSQAGWKENRTSVFSHISGVSSGGP
ncbi:MAG: hypothetical protein KDI44_02160 [Thiothrix sp.]|nr:hypothetical protein [Thiothrix sp.]